MIAFVGSREAKVAGVDRPCTSIPATNTTEARETCDGMYDRLGIVDLWIHFVFIEHAVMALRVFVQVGWPNVPGWLNDAHDILLYRTTKVYKVRRVASAR